MRIKRLLTTSGFGLGLVLTLFLTLTVFTYPATADDKVKDIPVGIGPGAVAVNPTTNKIYVANKNSDTVTVIDGNVDETSITITTESSPTAVAVDVMSNTIYVANSISNSVTIINGKTDTVITTVAVGLNPIALTANPVTHKIFVANYGENTVTVIDGSDFSTATIDLGVPPINTPFAIAVNPVTNRVYVANHNSNRVTVISGDTLTVIATIDTQVSMPVDVAVNPITNKIYVANSNKIVTIINGVDNSTSSVNTFEVDPIAIVVNPITNKVYVAISDTGNVKVIDGTTDNIINSISLGATPQAMAINFADKANKFYVATSNGNVFVVDGQTDAILDTINAGGNPNAVAVNPVTYKIYVTNGISNSTTLISAGVSQAGTFQDSGQRLGNLNTQGVDLDDFNGDGLPDAIVGNASPNEVWLNNGDGTFSLNQTLTVSTTTAVAIGNLNPLNDTAPDIVVVNADNQPNEVLLNDGSGNFTINQTFGSDNSQAVAIGNLNPENDTFSDLVVVNDGQPNQVLLNDGSGTFTLGPNLGTSNSAAVAIGNLNPISDTNSDVVVANAGQPNEVWLNDGQGNFTLGDTFGSSNSQAVAIGDFNGDTQVDILIANNGPNEVWLNDGSGNFSQTESLGSTDTTAVALGDLDGDGDLDAAFANGGNQADEIWLNDGFGSFTNSGQFLGNTDSNAIALADVNGDGLLDIFVGNGGGEPNLVWLNQDNLVIAKTDSADPAALGQPLTFTLNITNVGPYTATGVVLTDTLPAGMDFASSQPACSPAGGTVSCNLPDLGYNQSTQVTIVVTPTLTGTQLSTATVSNAEPDRGPANNTITETTTVYDPTPTLTIADLTVAEEVGATAVPVTLTNPSSFTVSVQYTVSPSSATSSDYSATNGSLSWSPGQTGPMSVPITITNDALDELTETVVITLANASQALIGDDLAVLTITDNNDDSTAPVFPPAPLLRPSETISSNRPVFEWTAADDLKSGVVSYTLLITGTPPFTGVAATQQSAVTVTTTQPIFTPTLDIPDGPYTWTVKAHDAAGNSSPFESPARNFVINAGGGEPRIYLPLILKQGQ